MAKTFTATLTGRVRDWTITITTTSGSGSATVDIDSEVSIVWGDPTGEIRWGAEVLPSFCRMRILDTDTNELWTELLSETNDWDALVAIDSDDDSYKWRGVVRLETITRPKFPDTEKPVLDLYCYDGISSLGEFTLSGFLTPTNNGVLQVMSSALVLARDGSLTASDDLDVDVVFDIFNNTAGTEWGRAIEFAGYNAFRDDKRGFGSLTWAEVLNELAELFNLRVFQQFEDYRTASTWPRWFVGHRNATGTNVATSDEGTMKISGTTESNADAGGVGKSSSGDEQTSADLEGAMRFTLLPQVYRVDYDVDITAPVSAVVLSRDPRPSGLGNDWILDTGSPTTTNTPSNGLGYDHLVLDDGEAVVLHSIKVPQRWANEINVQVKCNANLTSAGSGTLTFTIDNRDGGSGSSTVAFTVNSTTSSAFSGNDDFSDDFTVDGQVSITIDFSGSSLTCEVSDIYVEIRDVNTTEPVKSWVSPIISGSLTEGEIVSKRTRIANIGRSSTTNALVQLLLNNDGATDNIGNFQIEETGTTYYDVAHVCGVFLLNMRSEPLDVITGSVNGIFSPERSLRTEDSADSVSDFFVGAGVEVNLNTEISRGQWIKNINKR